MKTLVFLCTFLSVFMLKAQLIPSTISRSELEANYHSAKKEFAAFEKKHGHFIQTPNVKMHYLTWGKPSGVPLIWSHGSLTNGYELMGIAESLAEAGYYVIAIDYYGHGQTPIPAHEVSLYHLADDIKALMDKEKITRAVIGGWSRGGYISTAFYDAYPERVLGLILEDGGSVATNTHYHAMDSATLLQRVDDIFKDRYIDTTFSSELEAYCTYYDASAKGNQFELLAWITQTKEGRWAIGPGLFELFNMSNKTQFMANILRSTQVPLFAESMALIEPKIVFRNLKVPVLILDPTGKDDLFPFERENAKLTQQHPRLIDHKIYQNTGHNIHFERREAFIRDVIAFKNKRFTFKKTDK